MWPRPRVEVLIWCPRDDLVAEAYRGNGGQGSTEAAEEDTRERARYARGGCHRQYAAQQDRELKRDQSPFGPILAPVTSSRTHMTSLYKFQNLRVGDQMTPPGKFKDRL